MNWVTQNGDILAGVFFGILIAAPFVLALGVGA